VLTFPLFSVVETFSPLEDTVLGIMKMLHRGVIHHSGAGDPDLGERAFLQRRKLTSMTT
jgi:hypothetical protein